MVTIQLSGRRSGGTAHQYTSTVLGTGWQPGPVWCCSRLPWITRPGGRQRVTAAVSRLPLPHRTNRLYCIVLVVSHYSTQTHVVSRNDGLVFLDREDLGEYASLVAVLLLILKPLIKTLRAQSGQERCAAHF